MAWELVAEHLGITAGIHVAEKVLRLRFLKCRIIQRNTDIRVALSALLRISLSGKYLLVRNLHRPETFGPFGGVLKYHEAVRPYLDSLLFKPQDLGPGEDMHCDLRGFLPRKNLPKLIKWYEKSEGRETAQECLARELEEEVGEIGLPKAMRLPAALKLRRVRAVTEGPEPVPGQSYTQYRVFEVFEPAEISKQQRRFLKKLTEMASFHPDLLLASPEEIKSGRARDDSLIGHHAAYFLYSKRIRPDDVPFATERHIVSRDLPQPSRGRQSRPEVGAVE